MSIFASLHEAQSFLEHNPDIELFELFILDNNGVPRGKLLHRDELLAVYASGRPLPSTILGLTINGDDVENSGLVWDVGDIDCRAYPISGSLQRMPWRLIPTAAVQVSMHPREGLPATVADPRQLLAKVVDALKADGYYPVMAAELEFYLLDQTPDSHGRPQPARDQDGGRPRATQVYGLRELEQIEPFLADLYSACKLQGIPARTAISEYAPGQVEITLEHRADALQAMDEAVRYKRLVKGVAHKHGMTACFMAKPFDDLAGTGLHMHVSLADADGHNLFASDAADGTPLLRHAVGGMLSTLLDALLLFCPNANSYRRFQANSYAPLARHLGGRQPHRQPARAGRAGAFAAYRTPHLRCRRQPLPGCRGDPGRHPSWPARAARPRRSGARQRLRPGQRAAAHRLAHHPARAGRLPMGARSVRRRISRRVPGGQTRRIPPVHGRSRGAGLALVPASGMTGLTVESLRPFFHVAAVKLPIKVVHYRFAQMSP
ncbi:glutamine synthetase [Pseudomonas rhodesiae]|nr:glutamine synthetase [Pseudomonas rhodesiae]